MLRKLPLILTIAIAVSAIGTGEIAQAKPETKCKETRSAIGFYRSRTWDWQDRLGVHRTRSARSERWARSCRYLRWVARLWVVRAHKARRDYTRHMRRLARPAYTIRYVFGEHAEQAIAVARCESGLDIYATNGQYLGLFQMGSYARGRYGHSYTAYGQARAAYAYFVDSGRDWSPWECKPW